MFQAGGFPCRQTDESISRILPANETTSFDAIHCAAEFICFAHCAPPVVGGLKLLDGHVVISYEVMIGVSPSIMVYTMAPKVAACCMRGA